MADRSIRSWWRAAAAVAGSLCLAAACATTAASTTPSSSTRASDRSLRVLQVNLCGSGLASCYTGRSVSTAAAIIRARRPDVVTLNEICRDDVVGLEQEMSATHGGRIIASAFRAAGDRTTGGPYRCRNGQPYGIGVLAALRAASSSYHVYGARYPYQDLADPEERVWLCIHAVGGFYACTTHAASTSTAVALAQCRYFFRTALPVLRRRHGGEPAVVGADLNLVPDGSSGAQSCSPDGYGRADDGSRQDVIAGPRVAFAREQVIDMHGTTDHPGLLVEVELPS